MDYTALIEGAILARTRAYVPYSHFYVGAALLSKDGRMFLGCNVENAAYGPTNCAERTAFFKAVSEGVLDFSAIAIVGGQLGVERNAGDYCSPCGVCRQVMAEFCSPKDFIIILANSVDDYKEFTLEQIFPVGFYPKELSGK